MLALAFDPERRDADLVIGSGTLVTDTLDLETACIDLLLCDGRAETGERLTEGVPRRGYWADSFEEDGSRTGSLLWLLEEAEATPETAARAESYTRAALKPLVDDGHVKAVATSSEVVGEDVYVQADVTKYDGKVVTIGPFKVTR